MGAHAGPDIVEDKLVFAVDASNPRCYPETGSTVFNLAPYQYTGSILSEGSGSVFNPQGYWEFNQFGGIAFGVSQISTDPSAFLGLPSGELTYEIWNFPINIIDNRRLISTDRSDYNCFMWDSSGSTNRTLEWSYDDAQFHSSGWNEGEWYHIVGTGSRQNGEVSVYKNAERIYNVNYSAANPIGKGSNRPFGINQNVESSVDTDAGAVGYTSIVRIYGKALTPFEVRQNFQAHRKRHGI